MGEGVVLLTGPTRGGKNSLLRAIRANLSGADIGADTDFVNVDIEILYTFHSSALEAEERVEMGGGSFLSSRIMLDNKYYATELQLWRRESDNSVSLPCSGNATAINAPDGLEGIVVAFDLSTTSGRTCRNDQKEEYDHSHLFEAMEYGAIASGHSEILLRLCVGTKADLVVDNDELYQRRKICMEWCVDNGFEYIEVNSLKPWEGGSTREKEGIPRIVEALHCCLWSKARLKRRQRKCGLSFSLPTQNTEPGINIVNGDSHEEIKDDLLYTSSEGMEYRALTEDNDDDDEQSAVPTDRGDMSIHNSITKTALSEEAQERSPKQEFHDESFITERGTQDKVDEIRPENDIKDGMDALLANDYLGRQGRGKNDPYYSEDGCIEALGKLLSEAQGIREEAKTLPDHERRERASQMALKMLDLLGVEDSSDDSEGDV